jgi:hypothetical protein
VLNANRTYYLTRSQPPFLTSMIMEVHNAEKAAGHEDKNWLARTYGFAAHDYEMWTHQPHLAESTGLSRYYDFGNGPAPESLQDETGLRRKVIRYFLSGAVFRLHRCSFEMMAGCQLMAAMLWRRGGSPPFHLRTTPLQSKITC